MSDAFQPPLSSREERVAYNEAWARDLNRHRAEWLAFESGTGSGTFRCECWRGDCDARIGLTEDEWRIARAEPNRFVVAPGHVADDLEAVIAKHRGFWLVVKLGKAGEVAEALG
ncbi:MAG TPA: hypothetical protein VK919_02100 [Solirubrobacterales bacterium]|nr:hypothetical protein [Solirubrobacterales bacterium]